MEKFDVVIVGSGPSGYMCAYELVNLNKDLKVLLIDKGHDIYKRKCPVLNHELERCPKNKEGIRGCYPACSMTSGFGGAGAYSDGKYNITTEFGGWLTDYIGDEEALELINYCDEINLKFGATKIITNPYTEEIKNIEKRAIGAGLKLLRAKVRHLGTEENLEILKRIYEYLKTKVEIRSLFGCETKDGVCVHCYGRNLATGELVEVGEAVGIMAAQSIGEPGTQLTMRTFHSGGVAGGDITQGLPRVQELFEARNPKGEALISEISGVVTDIVDEGGIFTVKVTNELEEKVYKTNFNARLRVKKGDTIKNGGKITEGAISPKRLLEVADVGSVQRYIIKEVQKVYRSQGIGISDKHIEVIVRQMLRKVVIIDGGDTEMIPGTRVSLVEFTRLNKEVLLSGKRPAVAQPLVLGITKAALETESFLSAASFQETTRVLTDAAIKGKIDTLHGLKENVITGKLIPAGRGLLTTEQEKELLKDFDVLGTMKSVRRQYLGSHDKDYDNVDEVEDNVTIEEEYVSKVDNY